MFRKMFESDEWLLWIGYLCGMFLATVTLFAVFTGRLRWEDPQESIAIGLGFALLIALFVGAHLPRLLWRLRKRRAGK